MGTSGRYPITAPTWEPPAAALHKLVPEPDVQDQYRHHGEKQEGHYDRNVYAVPRVGAKTGIKLMATPPATSSGITGHHRQPTGHLLKGLAQTQP